MNERFKEALKALSVPFAPELIEYRPGEGKTVLAFVDPREYFTVLHQVAPGDWYTKDVVLSGTGDQTIIKMTLVLFGIEMTNVSDPDKKPTVAHAQVFKRCCSMFNLGAYIYGLPMPWNAELSSDGKRVVTPHLSIAVWAYQQAGIPVDPSTLAKAAAIPAAKQYNPHGTFTAPRFTDPVTPQPHATPQPAESGIVSPKRIAVLKGKGMTDEAISRITAANVKDVCGDAFANVPIEAICKKYNLLATPF